MQATDILKEEHRIIQQVLSCLERLAERSAAAGRLDADAARDAIEFFRCFADQCHHGKEEDVLFPMMEAKGFPRHGGPTGVMLHEHEQGREHVRGMEAAMAAASRGDPVALRQFAQHAENYVRLLRAHIDKEDHCLFSLANQVMSEDDQHELLESFERAEREHSGAGEHERYVAMANRLADRFGIPRAPNGSSPRTPWCCVVHA